MKSIWNAVGAILLLAILLLSCQTVQYTGRSQLSLISEADEQKLGVDAYEDVLKKTPRSGRADWQTQLRRIGQRIAAVAERPDYQWNFNVLQGQEVNAFALPGGKVAFGEGIMPITQDDSGVAVVMGHEVAHALARHGAERMSQAMGAQVLGQVLTAGVGAVSPQFAQDFAKLYGLGATVGVILSLGPLARV